VGTDSPNEFSRRAWAFLTPYVAEADALVFSRREFAWEGLDPDKLWIVAPSIDAFSAKNREMAPDVVEAILETIGLGPPGGSGMPVFERHDGTADRVDRRAEIDQDGVVPNEAPLVSQVSRWDRLKDPIGVLESFAKHVSNSEAHLVLVGPAVAEVADDPEGAEVLDEVRSARAELPADLRARTHLVCLPMTDVEENAAMVNAIQRRSQVVLQKSLAEGFGLTVAEAMWKSRPVIATRVGGIQDQIVDGESGVLIADPLDLSAVGAAIDDLLADPKRAEAMGAAARERVREDFLSTRHLAQYMTLIDRMIAGRAAAPAG
jgi:trehalose synthase